MTEMSLFTVSGYAMCDLATHGGGIRDVVLISILTCPYCGALKEGSMPTNSCQFFYECTQCGRVMRPRPGDCCVYCSYGTVPCPSRQKERGHCCSALATL